MFLLQHVCDCGGLFPTKGDIIVYNSAMSQENTVRVRLSDIELQALKHYADSIGVPMSEVLPDHLKNLVDNLLKYKIESQKQK